MRKVLTFHLLIFVFPIIIYASSLNEIHNLINNNENESALQELKKIKKKISKKDTYLYHYYMGKAYLKLKKYNQAIMEYNTSRKLKKDWYLTFHDLGLCYSSISNYKQAVINIQRSIKLNNNFSIAYYNLGNNYLKLKEYKKAHNNYMKALKIEKGDKLISKIYLGLGTSQQSEGQLSQAIESYKKAVKFNSGNWKAYMNLGFVYYNQDLYNEAIEAFKEVIKLRKKYSIAYFYIGNCYRGKKNYPKMEYYYKTSIKYNPDDTDSLYSLASFYCLKEKKQLMLKYLKKLFSVDEGYKSIIINNNLFKKYDNDKEFIKLVKGG